MEISKGLQQEIQLVQNKLKNAIRDHQLCVGKLKDDPNNADILGRIQEIQLHIVSLGRCQKQVVERLRKEVEAFKADNANDVKVSFASLLGLNNNNHITANNEAATEKISEVKVVINGLDSGRHAKEDYEEIVRNGDVTTPPRENLRKKERSVSVETLSAEDEIMEVEVDHNSREGRRQDSEERLNERKVNSAAQLNFLEILGLITTSRFTDLQNRRAERKRRSTANPQFVYSNWEIPTKRKRHNYLQSAGNVPQTRQTTARLNGPSPPPITSNKSASTVPPPKSTSPPTRTIAKSLIPTQKATAARPNILRNMSESRVFVNKAGRIENGNGQVQLSSGAKSSQQSNSKTVHIPGLPSGLTIERIESDSAVCINCRNPGTLTNCDNCEANYHVSCHSISPPPPRLCPKCAIRLKDGAPTTTKKNEELVAASYAPGVAGKGGEDPEIDKASCGLYKIGAAAKELIDTDRAVNQLPSSTFIIPISSNPVAAANSFNQSDLVVDDRALEVLESDSNSNTAAVADDDDGNDLSYNTSLVIGNQFSRASVTYVPQPQSHTPYDYQLPSDNGTEIVVKQQYFIVKKIAESGGQAEQATDGKTMQLSTTSGCVNTRGECEGGSGGKPDGVDRNLQLDKLTGRLAESIARGRKKSATRAIPGLNRILHADNKSITFASEHSDDNDLDKFTSGSYNVGISTIREQQQQQQQQQQSVVAIGTSETFECPRELVEISGKLEAAKQIEQRKKSLFSRDKHNSKSGALLHTLFAGYKKPDTIADCSDESRQREGQSGASNLDKNGGDGLELHRGESYCSDITGSAEHVKLEEAHLSAPLGAKLVRDDERIIVNDRKTRVETPAGMLSNRRRTTEDRRRTPALRRAFFEGSIDKGSNLERAQQLSRILMRPARKSLESRDSVRNETAVTNSSKFDDNLDFATFEKKYSNSFVKIVPGTNTLPDVESGSDTSSTDTCEEESSPPTSESDRIPRDEDKPEDNESKDLTSEERDIEAISDEQEVDFDEEFSEEIDEEEEEDLEDSPILDGDIPAERINDRYDISAVSTESMRVLEQFESAILQVDSGDITASQSLR